MSQNDMPLISVVIPVYKTEQYLCRCFDSVLNQTYKNIEIIVVNNGSTDNSDAVIKKYMSQYDNIKCVYHEKNQGLFQARISGAEEATGDYIAFLDSDDRIALDYYQLLIEKAIETQSDMVVGNFFYEFEDGRMEYQNLDPFQTQDITLEGDDVLKAFMEQEGLCFTWNLVWNKIYKKSLWDEGYKYFKAFSQKHSNIVMPEDLAYSGFFWSHASKVTNVNSAIVYYFQRSNKSSNTTNASVKQVKKYLSDIIAVFDFFKDTLIQAGKYETYRENYEAWKLRYARMYFDNYTRKGIIDEIADQLKDGLFGDEDMCGQTYEDTFFYSQTTLVSEVYSWLLQIKNKIISDETEYVSFDIFDTVVVRPFWIPSDLFRLMDPLFKKLTGAASDIDFHKIRCESENSCRRKIALTNPSFEEITLKEIYQDIKNKYFLSDEICEELMSTEEKLEIRFCTVRKTAFELYRLALNAGKKIIFTSDMYLPLNTIKQILHKNGYIEYERIFLSSDIRLSKSTGDLYQYVLDELDIEEPSSIVHIGDNWQSDVVMPQKFKICSFHFDKAVNIFQNSNPGIYAGESFSYAFENNPFGKDMHWAINGFMGLRTMLAVAANKLFDNPYVSINPKSDFNVCPSFIGYYPLGMYLYAVTIWLINKVKGKDISNIHFVARDGYLVQQAYELLKGLKKYSDLPDGNYLYLSRKSLLLAGIAMPIDMYSLFDKFSASAFTPIKFTELFKDLLSEEDYDDFIHSLKESFVPAKVFENADESERFVHYFVDKLWDKLQWSKYTEILKEYFSDAVVKNDVLFDIGYSGRAESALKSILGFAPDSYYIHSNLDVLNRRKAQNGFNNELFYNYKPNITGVLREHLFMKLSPSTIGYSRGADGKISPVFEEYSVNKPTELVTKTVQEYAIEFVKDMVNIFGDDLDQLFFREEDATAPFEYFLNCGKKADRKVFAPLVFEDNLGEGKSFRAVDFWGKEIERTLKLQRSLDPSDRFLSENEYIGIREASKYKNNRLHGTSASIKHLKTAIFLDKIEDNDSYTDKLLKCGSNTSNVILWQSIEKTIYPEIIKNWYMTHPGGFDEEKYDVYLSTHLNFIQQNTDIIWLNDVLKRIGDKPLLPMGIGFSKEGADGTKDFKLDSNSVKTLSAIAERCVSVGVKGEYSAEVLARYGIKNSVIIGCPSMYSDIAKLKNISVGRKTIEKLSGSFKPFWGKFSDSEKKLLEFFQDNSFSLISSTNLELTRENINDDKLFAKLKTYEQDRHIYFSADEWRRSFNGVDFVMGMDFYNNVAALQAGVPALFVTYETTGRELCRFFKLPCIDISEFNAGKSVKDYYLMSDYSSFKATIDNNYRKFIDFLTENGVEFHSVNSRVIKK